jgi:hypothetical protein
MARDSARDWRRLAIAAIAAGGVAMVFAFDAQSQAPAKKTKSQPQQAQEAQEGSEQAEEQEGAPKAAAKRKKQDPVEAQRAIDAAFKQLEAGKADQAAAALSATLAGGNIPPAIMAKALLYRGIAYRQQKKPAQAIADLTSALWLKGGLSDSDRKDALRQRASAYQEAGLTETGEVVAPAVPPATVAHAPASSPPAPARTASARPWSTETIQWPNQPAAQPTQQSNGWNLFGNLFGSPAPAASTPPPAPPPPPAVVAAPPPPPPPPPTVVAAAPVERPEPAPVVRRQPEPRSAAATSGWSSSTEAQSGQAPLVTGALPHAKAEGRFRIQVGMVRTQSEADALVAKIKQEHGPLLASRETEVDQTVVGNMGSLYRVRVGPFATQQETNVICARLRGTGLDCLVVTQ